MADSDEECDRKKRDKFRRERSDYSGERRKDHDKRSWREDYHESRRRSTRDDDDDRGDRDRRRHSSPHGRRDWSPPPMKRQRREGWDSVREYPGMGMMPPYGMMERRNPWMMHDMPHGTPMGGPRVMHGEMMMGFSPVGDARKRGGTMLTFKQFLSRQDDNIDDQEAIRLYAEYKADFKKQQLHQFFNDHKEDDWFLAKYHPTRVSANKSEVQKNTSMRVGVFQWLMEQGLLDQVPLTVEKTDEIIRIMNTAVILMEGGDENDLLSLDLPPPNSHKTVKVEKDTEETRVTTKAPNKEKKRSASQEPKEMEKSNEDKGSSPSKPSFMVEEPSPEVQRLMQQAKDYQRQMQRNGGAAQKKKKRREMYSFDGEEDTETSDDDAIDEDTAPPGTSEDNIPGDGEEEPPPPGLEEEREEEMQLSTGNQEEEAQPEETGEIEDEDTVRNGGGMMEVTSSEQLAVSPAPRPLHITKAVYLRHIPPNISLVDVLELVKPIPGYLRMAFAEPQADKGYERRGWVTFTYDVDIKDICSRLMESKVKDCQLSCIVNRDLTRRVKSGSEAAWSKRVLLEDVEVLLRLIHTLDKKAELWEHASRVNECTNDGETMDTEQPRENPVTIIPESALSVDETGEDVEEDEEEGVIIDPGTEMAPASSQLVKTVDRLIWYLRIVHSVDYFNGVVFPAEDHMPHRCGIITARAGKPGSLSVDQVTEHLKTMETNLKPLLVEKEILSDEALERLGKRDHEAEVEKFIEVNTQKQSEQKYLCPLSGKKFKGPEFVRKHIFNKHLDKVEEVKLETEFFNNYLKDPDRPVPLDSSTIVVSSSMGIGGSASKPPSKRQGDESSGGWGQSSMVMGGYSEMGGMGFGMRRGMRGRRPRGYFRGSRGRRIHQYNDLDNPEEIY